MNGTFYTDTTVTNGTTYYYIVRAVNGFGSSPSSNEASATPLLPAPTNLTAAGGATQTNLTWSLSPGSTGYIVKRGTSSGGPYSVLTSGLTSLNYTDSSVISGTTYFYVVSATDATSESPNSNEASATLGAVYRINSGGSAVGQFSADQLFTGGMVGTSNNNIATTDVPYAAPQAVYHSLRFGTNFSYTIPNLNPDVPYTVRLHFAESYWSIADQRIFNVTANGLSALSGYDIFHAADGMNKAVVEQFTVPSNSTGQIVLQFSPGVGTPDNNAQINGLEVLSGGNAPSSPSSLKVESGNHRADLSWVGVLAGTSFTIKRSTTAGGPYTTVATNVATQRYTDASVINGTTYYYVVSAVNAYGESANSNEVEATPGPFILSVNGAHLYASHGARTSATITVKSNDNFLGVVALSLLNTPADTLNWFYPPSVTLVAAPASNLVSRTDTTLFITVGNSVPPGTYTLTVVGDSVDGINKARVVLTVN